MAAFALRTTTQRLTCLTSQNSSSIVISRKCNELLTVVFTRHFSSGGGDAPHLPLKVLTMQEVRRLLFCSIAGYQELDPMNAMPFLTQEQMVLAFGQATVGALEKPRENQVAKLISGMPIILQVRNSFIPMALEFRGSVDATGGVWRDVWFTSLVRSEVMGLCEGLRKNSSRAKTSKEMESLICWQNKLAHGSSPEGNDETFDRLLSEMRSLNENDPDV